MFTKENHNGTINVCVDRCKQHEKYDNTDKTSPTVYTEAVLISAVIDAFKEQDVAVVSIRGAYLSVDMDTDVVVMFWGTMAELMVSADPTMHRK